MLLTEHWPLKQKMITNDTWKTRHVCICIILFYFPGYNPLQLADQISAEPRETASTCIFSAVSTNSGTSCYQKYLSLGVWRNLPFSFFNNEFSFHYGRIQMMTYLGFWRRSQWINSRKRRSSVPCKAISTKIQPRKFISKGLTYESIPKLLVRSNLIWLYESSIKPWPKQNCGNTVNTHLRIL